MPNFPIPFPGKTLKVTPANLHKKPSFSLFQYALGRRGVGCIGLFACRLVVRLHLITTFTFTFTFAPALAFVLLRERRREERVRWVLFRPLIA